LAVPLLVLPCHVGDAPMAPDPGPGVGGCSVSRTLVDLRCRICDLQVELSPDPPTRMAQIRAFSAAHNTHEAGIGVEIILPEATS
jgi:hypothetical protein